MYHSTRVMKSTAMRLSSMGQKKWRSNFRLRDSRCMHSGKARMTISVSHVDYKPWLINMKANFNAYQYLLGNAGFCSLEPEVPNGVSVPNWGGKVAWGAMIAAPLRNRCFSIQFHLAMYLERSLNDFKSPFLIPKCWLHCLVEISRCLCWARLSAPMNLEGLSTS